MTRCRTATLAELDQVLDWAAAEGWNPGLTDAQAFYAADAQGFFVALDAAQPVAAISVVNHNDAFAFLGLYIVRPDWRGRGIGLTLWQHALAHAGGRTVGLDGVPEQQANYAASGFAHAGGTTRFSGAVAPQPHAQIRPATEAEIPGLIAWEAAASGQSKPAYLRAWFAPAPLRQTLVLADDAGLQGACTVRQCRAGAKIGPLLANDIATAGALITHAATLWDGPLVIDVPGSAAQLAQLCHDLALQPGFETARMYRGPFEAQTPPIFAVTTLELG